ncbi:hypothetical protein AKJ40_00995 [candidate division MSBL1 archaeon SCGC-AAA259M10]|uniref:Uncharacterized protein n=2 Tax=candidate division MSBL1 TaxID=215777 RepID=A0A133V2J4_9EURY|nr:hypothetical protein AKJ36_00695 [candidate division MSBL1 archaeon SCGC-AAA259I07]KXB00653.1 hypothetical protein AKJ40_00995 [candidate division MSBL1 archaeon SCGC-AAA259M10]
MVEVDVDAVESLVKYSHYFGKDFVSLKKIREGQDPELVKEIRAEALEKLIEIDYYPYYRPILLFHFPNIIPTFSMFTF